MWANYKSLDDRIPAQHFAGPEACHSSAIWILNLQPLHQAAWPQQRCCTGHRQHAQQASGRVYGDVSQSFSASVRGMMFFEFTLKLQLQAAHIRVTGLYFAG